MHESCPFSCSLLTTYYLLPTTYSQDYMHESCPFSCSLLTTYYLLLTTYSQDYMHESCPFSCGTCAKLPVLAPKTKDEI